MTSARSLARAATARVVDYVADHPGSIPGRLAALRLGRVRPADVPRATRPPDALTRVYVGPVNFAGQGYAWARALEAARPGVGARNVQTVHGLTFPADTEVPSAVYHRSKTWQRAELDAASGFTHVLIEAVRPLFGRLYLRDVEAEVTALTERGVSVALMCHGTDVRLPSRHRSATPWSPYRGAELDRDRREVLARRNADLVARLSRPTFVSTPDLLADVPSAHWCPVVVDLGRWSAPPRATTSRRPVVAHIPSLASVKGTELVRPALQELHGAGEIEYREASGVPPERMPELWAAADIVLDQFRLGSYGVAACEAMAAGAVVVGHVTDAVRRTVLDETGHVLPIVEATPETVGAVVRDLATDPVRRAELAAEQRAFVRAVHDGRTSADVLLRHWIEAPSTTGAQDETVTADKERSVEVLVVAPDGAGDASGLGTLPPGSVVRVVAWSTAEGDIGVDVPSGGALTLWRRARAIGRKNAVARMLVRATPLDDGAVFWRSARRSRAVLEAARRSDVIVAADRDGVLAAWKLGRLPGVGAASVLGYPAANAAVARRSSR
jgi:hypothetical protein